MELERSSRSYSGFIRVIWVCRTEHIDAARDRTAWVSVQNVSPNKAVEAAICIAPTPGGGSDDPMRGVIRLPPTYREAMEGYVRTAI